MLLGPRTRNKNQDKDPGIWNLQELIKEGRKPIYAGYRGKYNSERIIRAAAFKLDFSWVFKVQEFIFATFSYFIVKNTLFKIRHQNKNEN